MKVNFETFRVYLTFSRNEIPSAIYYNKFVFPALDTEKKSVLQFKIEEI